MSAHGDRWVSNCGKMELRCGDYREVLADVECDAVITDPPYGARTHEGQRHGRRGGAKYKADYATSRGIGYASWGDGDVHDAMGFFGGIARGWVCALTSSDLFGSWRMEAAALGRTTFAPLAVVQRGMNVRLAGDGPSNWTVWLSVSRPRSFSRWGTLPGAYVGMPFDPGENTGTASKRTGVVGAKPVWIMRALVRDYSRPGDLICDPCAGGGTTLLAAAIEGRRAIGAELDPATYDLAVRRLSAGYTPAMALPSRPRAIQADLL